MRMRMLFAAALFCCPVLLPAAKISTTTRAELRERLEVITSETIPFAANGQIELRDSFGAVRVEGWDRPQVEITVRRATQRRYPASLHARMRNELDRVLVRSTRADDGHLLISTEVPSGAMFAHTSTRCSTDLDLQYTIHAPLHSNLVIRHGYGDVSVVNVTGSAEITGCAGGITLEVPPLERYTVDALSERGAVRSEIDDIAPEHRRPVFAGARLDGSEAAFREAHHLFLRMGTGDILIRRIAN